jgi:hypothetical protein
MQMIDIPAGLLGYRGVWGQAWTLPQYPAVADWGGGYVSTHASDAVGYITAPNGHETGSGDLFRVTIAAVMRAVMVPHGVDPNAAAIRAFVEAHGHLLNAGVHLIDALSGAHLAYVGPSAEAAYEVVLAAPFLAAMTQHELVATVTVNRGTPDYNHIRLANGRLVTRAQIDEILPPAAFVL